MRLNISGRDYTYFKNVSVKRSLRAFCSSFKVEMSSRFLLDSDAVPLKMSESVKVYSSAGLIFTGFVESLHAEIAEKTMTYSIAGRDKTCDFVDSYPDPAELNITDVSQIVKKLTALPVTSLSSGNVKAPIVIDHTKTCLENARTHVENAGLLLRSNEKGEILVTSVQRLDTGESIDEGENLISASLNRDESKRFSTYRVYAHEKKPLDNPSPWANEEGRLSIMGEAGDENVTRKRKFHENIGNATPDIVKKMAAWQAANSAAEVTAVSIVVKGDTTPAKKNWQLDTLISLNVPSLGIKDKFLIESIEISEGENGLITRLDLVDKNAYAPQPRVKKESKVTVKKGGL